MLDPRLQALKTKIAKVFLSLQLPLQLDGVPPLKAVSLPDTVCSQEDQSPSCITQRTKSGPAFLIFLLTSCSSAAPPSTDSGFLISCTVLFWTFYLLCTQSASSFHRSFLFWFLSPQCSSVLGFLPSPLLFVFTAAFWLSQRARLWSKSPLFSLLWLFIQLFISFFVKYCWYTILH